MNILETKVKVVQTTRILTILNGEATEVKIDRELKNLVREYWDYKVKMMSPQEFLVQFPNKSSLGTFIKLTDFQLSLYGLKARLEKTKRDSETSSILHTVWVKIYKIPDVAREAEAIKTIAAVVMEPLVVDELSLIRAGLVSVQGRYRNPSALNNGSLEFFFNDKGVFLRFEVETNRGVVQEGASPWP